MCPARSASQVPRAPLHPIVTHAAYLESAAILGQHWVAAGVAVRARRPDARSLRRSRCGLWSSPSSRTAIS